MNKEEREKFRNKLFKKLKRYNIQFGCWDEVLEILEKTISQENQELLKKIEGMKRDVLSQYAYQGPPSKAEIQREKLKSEGYEICKEDIKKLL